MTVSVVVPVRNAEATIEDTLHALLSQARGHDAEIIAAVSALDPTVKRIKHITDPQLRVLVLPDRRSIPQLRRDAVIASNSDLVVITEDHCLFPDGWLARFLDPSLRSVVAGGGVANGRRSVAGWAQYFTRYAQFMPPTREGSTRHLPGNNACYRRELLVEYRDLMKDGFWEAEFNAAIARRHQPFCLLAGNDVIQHQHRGIFEYAQLRFRHGRCYGARRSDKSILRIPFIPAILFWRVIRALAVKKRNWMQFALASPLILVYFLAWAMGEAAGYMWGPGSSCSDTD